VCKLILLVYLGLVPFVQKERVEPDNNTCSFQWVLQERKLTVWTPTDMHTWYLPLDYETPEYWFIWRPGDYDVTLVPVEKEK